MNPPHGLAQGRAIECDLGIPHQFQRAKQAIIAPADQLQRQGAAVIQFARRLVGVEFVDNHRNEGGEGPGLAGGGGEAALKSARRPEGGQARARIHEDLLAPGPLAVMPLQFISLNAHGDVVRVGGARRAHILYIRRPGQLAQAFHRIHTHRRREITLVEGGDRRADVGASAQQGGGQAQDADRSHRPTPVTMLRYAWCRSVVNA